MVGKLCHLINSLEFNVKLSLMGGREMLAEHMNCLMVPVSIVCYAQEI